MFQPVYTHLGKVEIFDDPSRLYVEQLHASHDGRYWIGPNFIFRANGEQMFFNRCRLRLDTVMPIEEARDSPA